MSGVNWFARLTTAICTGHPLVLSELDPAIDDGWGEIEAIRAEEIRACLLQKDLAPDPRGLSIRGARVMGHLDLDYCRVPFPVVLTNCRLTTVSLEHASVARFGFPSSAIRSVEALGARFAGPLLLSGAVLTNPTGEALTLDRAELGGGLIAEGLNATGTVRGLGAKIAGQLNLNGAILTNPTGEALFFDQAEIGGGGLFAEGLNATGSVRGLGAKIAGQLNLGGAVLTNPTGEALTLDGAELGGGLIARGLNATGLNVSGAKIAGQLSLRGAVLTNLTGEALIFDQAEIGGGLNAEGLNATGRVRGPGAKIAGQLNLNGAILTNLTGEALVLDQAEIGDALCALGLNATGTVRGLGAKIAGQLNLRGAVLTNPTGHALALAGAEITGDLVLDVSERTSGYLSIEGTTINNLVINGEPPGPFSASGWSIRDLGGDIRTNRKLAVRWLASAPEFASQPWHEIAAAYERNGQPADARRMRIAASHLTAKHSPQPTKALRYSYGALVGYGYWPLLAFVWLAVVATVAFTLSTERSAFSPTQMNNARSASVATTCKTRPLTAASPRECLSINYSHYDPALYAVTTVTPAAALQTPAWAPNETLRSIGLGVAKLCGWLLTAVLLAGLTGLLKKT